MSPKVGGNEAQEAAKRFRIGAPSAPGSPVTGREADLSAIQVHEYNPETGKAKKLKPFDTAISPFDRPCRLEDDAVPDDYPDRVLRAALGWMKSNREACGIDPNWIALGGGSA